MYKYYLLNIPDMYRFGRKVLGRLNRYPVFGGQVPARSMLDADLVGRIESFYAESNSRLAKEHGLPLQRYRYPLA